MTELVGLPTQPLGTPWPTDDWPEGGSLPAAAAAAIDEMFDDHDHFERTFAVLVVQHGQLVFERYADQLDHWDRPPEPITRDTPLLSWSMAKSILHAAVGLAVADGRLDFNEDYIDGETSHVIEMLFGEGSADVAGYAAQRPARAAPDTRFNYSSGTSNIVARILGDALGGEAATRAFLRDRLLGPLGMTTADPRFDDAGTFIGSSYVYAPAREFAKFGLLYLRGGVWDDQPLLPATWVDHGRRQRSWDPVDNVGYGAHWWTVGDDLGTFRASGYEGQMILLCPPLDLMVVRFGKTDARHTPDLVAWRARMVDAFR